MDRFLERYKLPKLTQEKKSFHIAFKYIEFVIKNLPPINSRPDGFNDEFYQKFK